MKKIKFLLIAFAVFSLSSMFSCNGSGSGEAANDTTKVSQEPVTPEETADTLATPDSLKK
jgi:hypothetical protein